MFVLIIPSTYYHIQEYLDKFVDLDLADLGKWLDFYVHICKDKNNNVVHTFDRESGIISVVKNKLSEDKTYANDCFQKKIIKGILGIIRKNPHNYKTLFMFHLFGPNWRKEYYSTEFN